MIGHKPICLKKEYFYHMRDVVCGRNLKGIGQPRLGILSDGNRRKDDPELEIIASNLYGHIGLWLK